MDFDVETLGLGTTQVGYLEAWELQRQTHADVVANERKDVLYLLEHEFQYHTSG